jgi:hypothetical protein
MPAWCHDWTQATLMREAVFKQYEAVPVKMTMLKCHVH